MQVPSAPSTTQNPMTQNTPAGDLSGQQIVIGQVIHADAPTDGVSWNSTLFDCARDEESCWWGTWCCWLVMARNVQTFDIGRSIDEALLFWAGIILFLVLCVLQIQPLGLLFGLSLFAYFVWRRANFRSSIRNKYQIAGSFNEDLLIHGACSCCAVCQESREAKLRGLPRLDFCFADSLAEQEEIHDSALGRNNANLTAPMLPESGNILAHLQAVSRTSRVIIILSAIVCFLSFVVLIASGRGQNILVLFLVFVQPLLILYFVYWRSRRQYALLDFVIKSFAVGFWFTTFQSVILESILQFVIFVVMMPLMTYGEKSQENGPPPMPPMAAVNAPAQYVEGQQNGNIGKLVFEVVQYYMQSAPDSVFSVAGGDTPAPTDDVAIAEHQRVLMQSHIVVVVITLLLMAYVVAAGVEETMKHFIVRCCQYPSPLKDPHSVLVYLMAGALGFATCENIEYVFGSNRSPIPGTSMLVGEMLVLLMRVCMPIHVICSVLQAANLSRVLVGEERLSLFQILLPALMLHGSFDFVLFFLGAIEYIYDAPSLALEILSLVLSVSLTLGGTYWAYKKFQDVQYRYEHGWQQVDQGNGAEDIGNNQL